MIHIGSDILSRNILDFIKKDSKRDKESVHNFKSIRRLFDIQPKTEYFLDEQSFNDLDMNTVYEKIDRTYSSAGESALYSMIRNIITDEDILIREVA